MSSIVLTRWVSLPVTITNMRALGAIYKLRNRLMGEGGGRVHVAPVFLEEKNVQYFCRLVCWLLYMCKVHVWVFMKIQHVLRGHPGHWFFSQKRYFFLSFGILLAKKRLILFGTYLIEICLKNYNDFGIIMHWIEIYHFFAIYPLLVEFDFSPHFLKLIRKICISRERDGFCITEFLASERSQNLLRCV